MFAKYNKYGTSINTHDMLKFAAILLMVVDHIGCYIYAEEYWFRAIGRMAAPIFLFLVGYSLNYKIKKDIVIFAGLMIAYCAVIKAPIFPVNILVGIILIRFFLGLLQKKGWLENQLIPLFMIIAVWWVLTFAIFDYGAAGMLFAVCGYLAAKKRHDLAAKAFYVMTLVFYISWQPVIFKFDLIQMGFVATGLSALLHYFYSYENKKLAYDGIMRAPILFVSRYSLEFYAIHVMILQGLAAFVFYPEKFTEFKWIMW